MELFHSIITWVDQDPEVNRLGGVIRKNIVIRDLSQGTGLINTEINHEKEVLSQENDHDLRHPVVVQTQIQRL